MIIDIKNASSAGILSGFLAIGTASTTVADTDQSNMVFESGAVLLHCDAPGGASAVPTEFFNEAFPLWIADLQKFANDGKVIRAHFLGELKQGMFIVAGGATIKEARGNAVEIHESFKTTLVMALEASNIVKDLKPDDISPCTSLEIGPVAVVPQ